MGLLQAYRWGPCISYSLNSLKGVIEGILYRSTTKEDTMSVAYGSCRYYYEDPHPHSALKPGFTPLRVQG